MRNGRKHIKKNGFSLVELLAVIAILVIIMLIALPAISSSIERKENKSLELVKGTVETAGALYYQSNPEVCYIAVQTLIDEDYLDVDDVKKFKDGYVVYNETTEEFEYSDTKPASSSCANSVNYLMSTSLSSMSSPFLRSNIKKQQIKSISIKKSISGHVVNNTDCWDVSANETKSVLLWVDSTEVVDGETYYNISIGQKGGVRANSTSSYLFGDLVNMTSIDLNNFKTGAVTNMAGMFNDCKVLTTLNLKSFNTRNVTNMYGMFEGCENLENIDVSSFDTKNVTDMSFMFRSCLKLTSLDLSNFDTSNVTNMQFMFAGCNSLEGINVSNFDTSKVQRMGSMFSSCTNLKNINVSNFDTSNVVNMTSMFGLCISLTSLDLSNFDTSKVIEIDRMFYDDTALIKIDMRNMVFDNVTNRDAIFSNFNRDCEIIVKDEKAKNWVLEAKVKSSDPFTEFNNRGAFNNIIIAS